MGEATKIQWAHDTFNPWIGCAKVSDGCKHCYAEVNTFARRSRANGLELWGPNGERHVTSDTNWKKPIAWNREAAASGEPRRVFCASLCDVFEDRPDLAAPRARLCRLIEDTPDLTWMLLTKRIENAAELVPESWRNGWPPNVWALVTVEDQAAADKRIPELLKVPAAVRGISAEPLLGPLDLRPWVHCTACGYSKLDQETHGDHHLCRRTPGRLDVLDWVIIGGESGPDARPFDLTWARSLVAQCRAAGVAPFMKQAGDRPVVSSNGGVATSAPDLARIKTRKGGNLTELPEDLRVREWPT